MMYVEFTLSNLSFLKEERKLRGVVQQEIGWIYRVLLGLKDCWNLGRRGCEVGDRIDRQ